MTQQSHYYIFTQVNWNFVFMQKLMCKWLPKPETTKMSFNRGISNWVQRPEHLCGSPFIHWNPNPQCDGVRRQSLWRWLVRDLLRNRLFSFPIYPERDLLGGIDSHDYLGWKVPQSATCKLEEAQESWEPMSQWCKFQAESEDLRTRNANARGQGSGCPSLNRAKSSFLHYFVLFRP